MSRYIDADALKIPNTHVDAFENCRNCKLLDEYQVREIINSAPSIDIVRCKECAYWQPYENNPDIKVCTRNYRMSFARYPEDYCSRGERKEGE